MRCYLTGNAIDPNDGIPVDDGGYRSSVELLGFIFRIKVKLWIKGTIIVKVRRDLSFD